jgi:hypothetical protein
MAKRLDISKDAIPPLMMPEDPTPADLYRWAADNFELREDEVRKLMASRGWANFHADSWWTYVSVIKEEVTRRLGVQNLLDKYYPPRRRETLPYFVETRWKQTLERIADSRRRRGIEEPKEINDGDKEK